MKHLHIETNRLFITTFNEEMAEVVHLNSLDEDNRNFVPDEVFETVETAKETILYLRVCYGKKDVPLVYPVLLKNKENIGYVQAVPYKEGWEVGYHITKQYTKNGYATEAIQAFLPVIMDYLVITEIYAVCLKRNLASQRVLEKSGFKEIYQGLDQYQGQEKEIYKYLYALKGIE